MVDGHNCSNEEEIQRQNKLLKENHDIMVWFVITLFGLAMAIVSIIIFLLWENPICEMNHWYLIFCCHFCGIFHMDRCQSLLEMYRAEQLETEELFNHGKENKSNDPNFFKSSYTQKKSENPPDSVVSDAADIVENIFL